MALADREPSTAHWLLAKHYEGGVMNKFICVLANSIKFGGRCIAGKEVVPSHNSKQYNLTQTWLRPLGRSGRGELNYQEYICDNSSPSILDIVEIPFDKPLAIVGQPEDWSIRPNVPWKKHGAFEPSVALQLLDNPTNLWLENPRYPDRVSTQWLISNNSPSLALVQVTNLQIVLQSAIDFNTGNPILKRRCQFDFGSVRYDLALTDPAMQAKYFPNFPAYPAGPIVAGPPTSSIVCVSLSPALNGMHYKLAAAII